MKAPVDDQVTLLQVQALDTTLRRITHKAKTLPEHADLVALSSKRGAAMDRLVAAETALSDLHRQQVKAEADVAQVRDRAARDRARMEAGAGAKDLVGLQHELDTLAKRQAALEDIELELMEQAEAAQQQVEEIRVQTAGYEEKAAQLTASRDAQLADLRAEADDARAQRQLLADRLDPSLMALYARVVEHSGGVGAATLTLLGSGHGRCEGCRLELNPLEVGRLTAAAPDDVVQCEECSCILVRPA